MNSNSKSFVVIIIFSLVLSVITPSLNNLVSKVRYGSLSEKEISQEILLESKSFYENLSAKDYAQFGDYYYEHLLPIYILIDSLNVIFSDSAQTNLFSNINNELNFKIDTAVSNTQNKHFKTLSQYVELEYNDISNAIQKIEKNSISEYDKEVNHVLIKNNINKLQNNLSNIILTLAYRQEQNEEKILINNFIVDKVNKTSSSKLIDNKPYFSLPHKLAQDKEDEIFSYLKLNPKDPMGLIALTQLYLEMRNISDAKLIYEVFLSQIKHFPNDDIELAKELTQKQIQDYYNENIEADLTNSLLTLEENLNIAIEEDYDIVGSTKGKKILITLPYSSKSIFVNKITNQNDSLIENYNIRGSWKNSSILELENSANIQQLHLKYTTNDFIKYDKEFGKYQFKYGGLTTSSRLVVNTLVPNTFKITSLQSLPAETKVDEEFRKLKWINPVLPYKISALKYVGAKYGIAGEFASFYKLYIRLCFTVLVIVLFFFFDWLSKKTIRNNHLKNLFYFIFAILTTFLILNDIKYVDLITPLVSNIDFKIIRWGYVVLVFILVVFMDREYEDNSKPVRLLKAVLEFILFILFLKLYIQNSDYGNKLQYFIVIGVGLFNFWDISRKISKELNLKMATLITYIVIIGFVVFFITKNLDFYKFPKSVIDTIGYIFGTVIIIMIITCYMASIKEIRNVKKKGFFDEIEEWIALRLGDFAKDTAKILIVFLIILSFFFKSILVPVVVALVASFFQKHIDNFINRAMKKATIKRKEIENTKDRTNTTA